MTTSRILLCTLLFTAAPALAAGTGTASISSTTGSRVASVGSSPSRPFEQMSNANYIRAGAAGTGTASVGTVSMTMARPIDDLMNAKSFVASKASVTFDNAGGKLNLRQTVRAGSVGYDGSTFVAGIGR